MTVSGRTLGENVEQWTAKHGEIPVSQDLLRPLNNPLKEKGHIRSTHLIRYLQIC